MNWASPKSSGGKEFGGRGRERDVGWGVAAGGLDSQGEEASKACFLPSSVASAGRTLTG